MNLQELVESLPNGGRHMAAARLRHEVIDALQDAFDKSGRTQTDLAGALDRSKSAVSQVFLGDGNLRISTLAEYLYELGMELAIELVPIEAMTDRLSKNTLKQVSASSVSSVLFPVVSLTLKDNIYGSWLMPEHFIASHESSITAKYEFDNQGITEEVA
jgi:transcriptional regulator with XRE-family HTH domain